MNLATNRTAKAQALVDALDRRMTRLGFSPELDARALAAVLEELFTDGEWCQLATLAGVKPPSRASERHLGVSQDTRREVVRLLRDRARLGGQLAVARDFSERVRGGLFAPETPAPVALEPIPVCNECGIPRCASANCGEYCGIRGVDRYRFEDPRLPLVQAEAARGAA